MNKPLRILAVNGESDPAETGAFIEMRKRGIDITVITWPGTFNYEKLIKADVPTIPYVLKGKFSPEGIRVIHQELMRKRYDILHMCDKRGTMNGLWASIGLDIKKVAYRGIVGNVSYFDPQMWFYLLNPRLDHIICVCEAIRQDLLSLGFGRLQIRRDVPVTVYKGHDPGWYAPPFENLKQFGIPDNTFVVACTVRGVRRKGVPVLLEAIDNLPPNLNIHFLLAGTNMDNSHHKKLVKENRYRANIHLHGFLKRMPWILPNCHVSVLPALRREGLPRGIIEAMIGGTVPIVTQSGGSPELVENGKSGFVVPPGKSEPITKAILELYNNENLYGAMQCAAQERIKNKFRVEDTAKKLIALYHGLVA